MSWGEVGLGPSKLLTPPVLEGRKDQSCDEGDFEACLPTLPYLGLFMGLLVYSSPPPLFIFVLTPWLKRGKQECRYSTRKVHRCSTRLSFFNKVLMGMRDGGQMPWEDPSSLHMYVLTSVAKLFLSRARDDGEEKRQKGNLKIKMIVSPISMQVTWFLTKFWHDCIISCLIGWHEYPSWVLPQWVSKWIWCYSTVSAQVSL